MCVHVQKKKHETKSKPHCHHTWGQTDSVSKGTFMASLTSSRFWFKWRTTLSLRIWPLGLKTCPLWLTSGNEVTLALVPPQNLIYLPWLTESIKESIWRLDPVDPPHFCPWRIQIHIKAPRHERGGAPSPSTSFTDSGGQEFQVEGCAGWVRCAEERVFPLTPILFLEASVMRSSVGVWKSNTSVFKANWNLDCSKIVV